MREIGRAELQVGDWIQFTPIADLSLASAERLAVYDPNQFYLVIERNDWYHDKCHCSLLDRNGRRHDYCAANFILDASIMLNGRVWLLSQEEAQAYCDPEKPEMLSTLCEKAKRIQQTFNKYSNQGTSPPAQNPGVSSL